VADQIKTFLLMIFATLLSALDFKCDLAKEATEFITKMA